MLCMRAMTTMRGIDGLQAIALMKNDYSELRTADLVSHEMIETSRNPS